MTTTNSVKNQPFTFFKVLGILVLVFFAIILWELSIPTIITWYLYKKNKTLSKKTKLITSIVTFMVFILLGRILSTPDTVPVLTLSEPQNGITVQSDKILFKGNVSPRASTVTINGVPATVDGKGGFIYNANLKAENNSFGVEAVNGSKKSDLQVVKVSRVFTESELAEKKKQEELARVEGIEKAKQVLQKEINSLNKPFDNSAFRGNVESMQVELALFGSYATLIQSYKNNSDPEVKRLVNTLENKVSQLQINEFPKLRKAYVDLMAKKVWEENIVVSVGGSGNKVVTFVGGIFANNKNIQTTQASLEEMMTLLRFSRVNYKWYKYDNDYTYYDLESSSDAKIEEIKK